MITERNFSKNEILDAFSEESINQQMFEIVKEHEAENDPLLSEISNTLGTDDNWIVINLDPLSDLLSTLLEELYKNNICADLIKIEKINLSFFVLSSNISDSHPIYDVELAIRKILEVFKSHGKRLLICIDNIKDTESMQCFISAFQIMVREDLPVFLLIAGQREDICSLQDEKNLTFLYRAPKVVSR